jgi:hypothetical protein
VLVVAVLLTSPLPAHQAVHYPRLQVQDAQAGVRGWLFARGAFDKGDMLYLRKEEEKRRFVEQEQEETERLAVRTRLPGRVARSAVPALHIGWRDDSRFRSTMLQFLQQRARLEAEEALRAEAAARAAAAAAARQRQQDADK